MGFETVVYIRNAIIGWIYRNVLKRLFFRMEPENVHDRMVAAGRVIGSNILTRKLTSILFSYSNKKLEQEILGIKFSNPVGLAAGFDKDAQLTDIIGSVGFGFEEVGSITGEPCKGNPKPRLWRLPKSKGLVVYYGLKNDGCEEISRRLRGKKFRIPIGTSIAKTNSKETVNAKEGVKDYIKAFRKFTDIGDYYTINISCPNVFGGQPFTDAGLLDMLLKETDKMDTKKPVFLKISPDLTKKEVETLLGVCSKHRIHGFICTNLTKNRNNKRIVKNEIQHMMKGGISGKIVENLSNDLIKYIYGKTKGKYIIIGCGGIFSAEDAYRKIRCGASLVQMITGMIFQGPQTISQINRGLVKLLEKDGFKNIKEAVGKDS